MKKSKICFLLVGLILLPSLAAALGDRYYMSENGFVNKPAAEFTLSTISGQKLSLTQMRAGNNAILFFWATWCPHCRESLYRLSGQLKQMRDENIKIILIDVGEERELVSAFLKKNNIALDCFLDTDTDVSAQYKLIGVPTFVFLNKNGTVKAVEHYIPDNYKEILEK